LHGAFFIGGGGRGMTQRYTFKDGQVTVQDSLYDLLTQTPREASEVVVLLVIQKQKQEAEDAPTE
jgi:hypothetical protein